jgi:hypothetical protein
MYVPELSTCQNAYVPECPEIDPAPPRGPQKRILPAANEMPSGIGQPNPRTLVANMAKRRNLSSRWLRALIHKPTKHQRSVGAAEPE